MELPPSQTRTFRQSPRFIAAISLMPEPAHSSDDRWTLAAHSQKKARRALGAASPEPILVACRHAIAVRITARHEFNVPCPARGGPISARTDSSSAAPLRCPALRGASLCELPGSDWPVLHSQLFVAWNYVPVSGACQWGARRQESPSLAIHCAWYNFVRIHQSLRVTPAMAPV